MDGTLVEVEAAISPGLPRTVLVGLPDAALHEARDRCRAALTAVGLGWPSELLTINLTPASLPKAGTHYDLAIAAAVLAAARQVPRQAAQKNVLMGEVGLDGRVRRVRGILPGLLAARQAGWTSAIVPLAQVGEARLVDGLEVHGVATLEDLVEVLHGREPLRTEEAPLGEMAAADEPAAVDLSDLLGQPEARWAAEVAAAGGHHMFLHGPPGVGKTMLAMRLPGLLPDLTLPEALEASAIHSLAGEDLNDGLIRRPPFSSPHHNATMAAMVGGGSRLARPGAISLAHRGVLFLDEAPELSPQVMEALRTPMEAGYVSIARSHGVVRFPSQFQLVMAANPCPCGFSGVTGAQCRCAPNAIRRYNARLSGPILDRIDIHQRMTTVSRVLRKADSSESTAVVAARVSEARERSQARLQGTGWRRNAEIPGHIARAEVPDHGLVLIEQQVLKGRMSPRGVDKVARLARTLADLAGRSKVSVDDVMAGMTLNQDEWMVAV
ncbi:MAG: YifB family Mg chelatase-like AAA ATPase [Propionibacteriaceae bacterium]|nr:YifB family Mg chelatase-like AAA ATPase [Propionibacteriaceae bacterium]